MSRLIDANALKATMIETLEQIKANPKMDGQEMHIIAGIAMLGEMIDDSPTIDAVEVVRCSQCKHRMHLEGATDVAWECALRYGLPGVIAEEDYCSYGERKEGDHEM